MNKILCFSNRYCEVPRRMLNAAYQTALDCSTMPMIHPKGRDRDITSPNSELFIELCGLEKLYPAFDGPQYTCETNSHSISHASSSKLHLDTTLLPEHAKFSSSPELQSLDKIPHGTSSVSTSLAGDFAGQVHQSKAPMSVSRHAPVFLTSKPVGFHRSLSSEPKVSPSTHLTKETFGVFDFENMFPDISGASVQIYSLPAEQNQRRIALQNSQNTSTSAGASNEIRSDADNSRAEQLPPLSAHTRRVSPVSQPQEAVDVVGVDNLLPPWSTHTRPASCPVSHPQEAFDVFDIDNLLPEVSSSSLQSSAHQSDQKHAEPFQQGELIDADEARRSSRRTTDDFDVFSIENLHNMMTSDDHNETDRDDRLNLALRSNQDTLASIGDVNDPDTLDDGDICVGHPHLWHEAGRESSDEIHISLAPHSTRNTFVSVSDRNNPNTINSGTCVEHIHSGSTSAQEARLLSHQAQEAYDVFGIENLLADTTPKNFTRKDSENPSETAPMDQYTPKSTRNVSLSCETVASIAPVHLVQSEFGQQTSQIQALSSSCEGISQHSNPCAHNNSPISAQHLEQAAGIQFQNADAKLGPVGIQRQAASEQMTRMKRPQQNQSPLINASQRTEKPTRIPNAAIRCRRKKLAPGAQTTPASVKRQKRTFEQIISKEQTQSLSNALKRPETRPRKSARKDASTQNSRPMKENKSQNSKTVSKARPKTKRPARRSCVNCYFAKRTCDNKRPCTRCIRLHREDTCKDRPLLSRGGASRLHEHFLFSSGNAF